MKTIGEILTLSTEYLTERKIASPRLQAEELLADLLACKRLDLYLRFDKILEEGELAPFREKLRRRGKGEPLGYLLSEAEFLNCKLNLSQSVLIPRQETEILLSKVVNELKGSDLDGKHAWDLCTGSGCLGIALKKAFPSLELTCSDLSPEALEVARANAQKNEVQISFAQGDLLRPFAGKKADFILCNPPYVSSAEYLQLDPEVRNFEPKLALVAGPTGLEFYERLARELPPFLHVRAKLFFEIGTGQGEAVMSLFSKPCWKRRRVEKDWAGHDRLFFLEFE